MSAHAAGAAASSTSTANANRFMMSLPWSDQFKGDAYMKRNRFDRLSACCRFYSRTDLVQNNDGSSVMEVSRRSFLKVSSGGAVGGALGGLAGLGANLAPTLARAQELRIKDA